jgi:hypothetical protein
MKFCLVTEVKCLDCLVREFHFTNMGVRGLATFLKTNMTGLAHHANLAGAFVVVDGTCLAYHLVQGMQPLEGDQENFLLRTDYLALHEAYSSFLSSLRKGCRRILVVTDAPCIRDAQHETHTFQRRKNQARSAARAMAWLQEGAKRREIPKIPLPLFAEDILAMTCRDLGIECIVAEEEADVVIAEQHSALVLSNDTDFLIYERSTKGVLPFWALDFAVIDGEAWGHIFTSTRLANVLKIDRSALALIACLCGNDFIDPDEWEIRRRVLKHQSGSSGDFFRAAADIVRKVSLNAQDPAGELAAALFRDHSSSARRKAGKNRSQQQNGGEHGVKERSKARCAKFRDAILSVLEHYKVRSFASPYSKGSRCTSRAGIAISTAATRGVAIWCPIVLESVDNSFSVWDALRDLRGRLYAAAGGHGTDVREFVGIGSVRESSCKRLSDFQFAGDPFIAALHVLCGFVSVDGMQQRVQKYCALQGSPTSKVDVTASLVVTAALHNLVPSHVGLPVLWAFLRVLSGCKIESGPLEMRQRSCSFFDFVCGWNALQVVAWHVEATMSILGLLGSFACSASELMLLAPIGEISGQYEAWGRWTTWQEMMRHDPPPFPCSSSRSRSRFVTLASCASG